MNNTARQKERTNMLLPISFFISLQKCSYEEVGKLIMAGYWYITTGVLPDFSENGKLDILFDQFRNELDKDGIKWNGKVLQSSYAGWCSSLDKAGQSYLKISFEEWEREQQSYDTYCKSLPPEKRPLFNDFLRTKRDNIALQTDTAILPWNSD